MVAFWVVPAFPKVAVTAAVTPLAMLTVSLWSPSVSKTILVTPLNVGDVKPKAVTVMPFAPLPLTVKVTFWLVFKLLAAPRLPDWLPRFKVNVPPFCDARVGGTTGVTTLDGAEATGPRVSGPNPNDTE